MLELKSSIHKREGFISNKILIELIPALHQKGASLRFQACGLSMYPSIRSEDIIIISSLEDSPPQYGDIIAFQHPISKKLIVHRAIKINKKQCLLRGDNLSKTDGWIPLINLLGRVSRIERDGKIINWPFRNLFFVKIILPIYRGFLMIKTLLKRLIQLSIGIMVFIPLIFNTRL